MTPDMQIRHILIKTAPRQRLIELIAAHIFYAEEKAQRSPRKWYQEAMEVTRREGLQ